MEINSQVTSILSSCVMLCISMVTLAASNTSRYNQHIPDEQRLFQDLMEGYESSTRPVINASHTLIIDFELTLTQITDLDERSQVLTTNVFIDQTWEDENLPWNPLDYNDIKTLRIPEERVWLPDTFLFNNADDGTTGFMRGMYVLVNYNGTVLWRVPIKLKSSCKVDIAYFPFDDQKCKWKFGSWIYSGPWIDFHSSIHSIHMEDFIDNSEWELLSLHFEKSLRQHPSSLEEHPDLLFTLHIRRRTLYYIFNIIAPCVMLSVLTLLTFWLPSTSGEKISLGLSVFLAFSMFMLLIAEEVPATSESVPLIGIYLTTVMTMTSVSVIMAVMVINLYNRGSKAMHAPRWLRIFVLEGLSRVLGLKHDIDKMTKSIKLDKEEEEKYSCLAHPHQRILLRNQNTPSASSQNHVTEEQTNEITVHEYIEPRPCQYCDSNRALDDITRLENMHRTAQCPYCQGWRDNVTTVTQTYQELSQISPDDTVCEKNHNIIENASLNTKERNTEIFPLNHILRNETATTNQESSKKADKEAYDKGQHCGRSQPKKKRNDDDSSPSHASAIPKITITDTGAFDGSRGDERSESSSPVWRKRPSVILREQTEQEQKEQLLFQNTRCSKDSFLSSKDRRDQAVNASKMRTSGNDKSKVQNDRTYIPKLEIECPKKAALIERRQIVVEWQTIAAVIDRLLFWIFLLGTIVAYVVILFIIPRTKPRYGEEDNNFNTLRKSSIKIGSEDVFIWSK